MLTKENSWQDLLTGFMADTERLLQVDAKELCIEDRIRFVSRVVLHALSVQRVVLEKLAAGEQTGSQS